MSDKFKQIGNDNINFKDFCSILDEADLASDLGKIRKTIYEKKYGKHFRCRPFLKICFLARKHQTKSRLKAHEK